jgi:hypothetical protein
VRRDSTAPAIEAPRSDRPSCFPVESREPPSGQMVVVQAGAVDPITLLVAFGGVVVVVVVLRWLKSHQDIDLGPQTPKPETHEACFACGKVRSWRVVLAVWRQWRHCPACNAAYCDTCKGLLWAEGSIYRCECLDCGHEWYPPLPGDGSG